MPYDFSKVLNSNLSLAKNYAKREEDLAAKGKQLPAWQKAKLNLATLGGNAYDTNRGAGAFNDSFYSQLDPADQKYFGYSVAPVGSVGNKGSTAGKKKNDGTYSIEYLLGLGDKGTSPYQYGYSKEGQESKLADPKYDVLKSLIGG